tara:strand:+ start:5206 stop:5802 length:597 start_codon:yes stop_codon:yes gene_type:complete
MGIAPRLQTVRFGTATTATANYTSQAIDRDDTTHVQLDGMTSSQYLYMGLTGKGRGFYFNMDGTNFNDVAATLDMEFASAISAGSPTWTDVASDSDGTDSSGDTLKQDGLYSFTLPAVVKGIIPFLDTEPLFWYRFAPSTTLSATVDVIDLIPACDTTNYSYMEAGLAYQFALNLAQNGAFEFDHTATDTLNITWIQH